MQIKRKINFRPPDTNPDSTPRCDACGTDQDLRSCSLMTGDPDVPVCRMCFIIWYDVAERDPERLGMLSNGVRAQGFDKMTEEAYKVLYELDKTVAKTSTMNGV